MNGTSDIRHQTSDHTLADALRQKFPQWVIATHAFRGDQTVVLRREGLLEVCRFLRDDPAMAFNFIMSVTAVDLLTLGRGELGETFRPIPAVDPSITWATFTGDAEGPRDVFGNPSPRFEVVYHLLSLARGHRLRLKVPIEDADAQIDSVTTIWKGANWFEREAWDMFGILFTGHPNMKRLLMYEGFQGHPLRKDYPVNRRQPLVGPVN